MFQIFSEHKNRTKQIFLLAKTELLKTYKGAFFGAGWAIVKPLFTLFVYWFAFEIGLRAGAQIGDVPRFLFMLTGYVPWYFMHDAILFGAKSIRANRQFVIKMAFPVSTIMTFVLLSKLFVHLGLMVPTLVYVFISGFTPTIHTLQFFLFLPLMFLFFLFLSWTTAPMSAFSLDFENFVAALLTGLFWLSGIVWDASAVGGSILPWVMRLNPINFLVDGYRCAFIYKRWFWETEHGWITAAIFLAEMLILALFGMYNYKRLRKKLPDVL